MIFEKWLDELYFEWITSIVIPDKNIKHSYYKLLELLNGTLFGECRFLY